MWRVGADPVDKRTTSPLRAEAVPAHRHARHPGWPCCAIHRRMSSARQTVTRSESLTGSGKVRAWMRRQSVDLEMGTKASTWGWRKKPVSGNVRVETGAAGVVGRAREAATFAVIRVRMLGMIGPRHGGCR